MRATRAKLAVLLLGLVGFACACSALIGIEGPPYGPATDGGVPPRDGDPDSNVDASAPDGCPSGWFCDSFERANVGNVKEQHWPTDVVNGGGTLTIDTAEGLSPPSLHAYLPNVDAGTASAVVVRRFDPASFIHLQVAMKIEPLSGRKVHLAMLDFAPETSSANHYLYLYADVTGTNNYLGLGLEPAEQYERLSSPVPTDWHTYDIEVTFSDGKVFVGVTMDKSQVVFPKQALTARFSPVPFDLRIGSNWATAGTPSTVWFDDVKLETKP